MPLDLDARVRLQTAIGESVLHDLTGLSQGIFHRLRVTLNHSQ